ncbi:MAG: penicillin-insensitive murein endopeptidase, partial [Pyrinomonadaceae bacterium]
RRIDAMVKALKYMKLLTVDEPPKTQSEVVQKPTPENKSNTENTSQKANEVIFDKPNSGAVDILLPASGKGYVTYKNDGNDHYGTAQTVKALQIITAKWNEKHPELKIQIGDMSRKGGGYLYPHGSHRKGIDADVRPFRKDGKLTALNAVADPQNFDREKTREFIKLVKETYPNTVILFNDKQLIKEGLTKPWEGHDDHLHIRFK